MSDTPRTDAESCWLFDGLSEVVTADFARGLERELAEAKRDAERYRYWRDRHGWTGYFDYGPTNSEAPDDIDAAIDASIKEGK